MALYAADGSINVTIVDGETLVGLQAADGSWNVIPSPGSGWVGSFHPSGALYVTLVTTGLYGAYSADGSLNVVENPFEASGATRITVVAGAWPA